MPGIMNGLDPAPQVELADPWRLLATQAGRSAYGLRATVQLWKGPAMRQTLVCDLDEKDEVHEVVEAFAAECGVTHEVLEQALRDLYVGIEEALRRQAEPVERPKKADLGEEAQRQGPAIADCFTVDDHGVWYRPPVPPDWELPPPEPVWICGHSPSTAPHGTN